MIDHIVNDAMAHEDAAEARTESFNQYVQDVYDQLDRTSYESVMDALNEISDKDKHDLEQTMRHGTMEDIGQAFMDLVDTYYMHQAQAYAEKHYLGI